MPLAFYGKLVTDPPGETAAAAAAGGAQGDHAAVLAEIIDRDDAQRTREILKRHAAQGDMLAALERKRPY